MDARTHARRRTGDRRTCKDSGVSRSRESLCVESLASHAAAAAESARLVRGASRCPQPGHCNLQVGGSGLVEAVAALALPPDGLVVGERGGHPVRARPPAPRPRRGGGRPGRPHGHRGHLHRRARAALVALAPAARRARPQPHLLLSRRRRPTTAALRNDEASKLKNTATERRELKKREIEWVRHEHGARTGRGGVGG
jgi:hypothetical protein